MQLGRTWTALIILQVALAVAALPVAIYNADGASFGWDGSSPPRRRPAAQRHAADARATADDVSRHAISPTG